MGIKFYKKIGNACRHQDQCNESSGPVRFHCCRFPFELDVSTCVTDGVSCVAEELNIARTRALKVTCSPLLVTSTPVDLITPPSMTTVISSGDVSAFCFTSMLAVSMVAVNVSASLIDTSPDRSSDLSQLNMIKHGAFPKVGPKLN